MWKGQATKDRPTKSKQEPEKVEQPIEQQQEYEEVKQAPESYDQLVEAEPAEEYIEIKQPPKRVSEKEELAKKVKEQRESVWSGEPEVKSKQKKRKSRSTRRVLDYQQDTKPAESLPVKQTNEPEAKKKSRDYKPKAPTLKLAIIVMLGLVGAIAIGVTIGYLVASG